MTPTDTEIVYFLEVYTARNFTKAARGLKISQPALTQSILRLEEKLNAKLFIRTKQGCHPMKSADFLFEKSTKLMECWSEIKSGIAVDADKLAGRFRLGCHQSVGAYTLPNFIKAINKSAPAIQISLSHDYSRNVLEKIIRFELDCGFVVNPKRHADLILMKLGADKVRYWRNNQTKDLPKILYSDLSPLQLESTLRGEVAKYFLGWKHIETHSLELIRTLTIQGAGVGFLPERVALSDSNRLNAILNLPSKNDEIYFAYRMDTLKSAAGRLVIQAAKDCIDTGA